MMVRWTRRWGVIGLAGWAVLTLVLTWQALAVVFEKGTPTSGKLLLIAVSAVALVVAIVAVQGVVGRGTRFRSLLRPVPLAGLYIATFSAFQTMTAVAGTLSPKPAIESAPGVIQHVVEQDRATDAAILGHIVALRRDIATPANDLAALKQRLRQNAWGEEGCEVTYRFTPGARNAIAVDRVKRVSGMADLHDVGVIAAGPTPRSVVVEWQFPPEAAGTTTTFLYAARGSRETLTWQDNIAANRDRPLLLVPCGS